MPICIKCSKDISGGEDTTPATFVCSDCQDFVNLKEWKKELKIIEKDGLKATPTQMARKDWLVQKIKRTEED